MFNPQNLVTVPRDHKNVKLAKMEVTEGVEQGGRWYRLLAERDQKKFRVLSEEEIMEEFDKSKSYEENIMKRTVTKFATDGHTQSSPNSRVRKSVMVGVNSRNRTADNVKWKEELQTAKHIADLNLNGDDRDTFDFTNGSNNSSSYIRHTNSDFSKFPTVSSSSTSSSHLSKSANNSDENTPLAVAIETMSEKYMENINVIKMLFAEKTAMESKIKKMEKALRRGSGLAKGEDGESLPPDYDFIDFDAASDPEDSYDNNQARRVGGERSSSSSSGRHKINNNKNNNKSSSGGSKNRNSSPSNDPENRKTMNTREDSVAMGALAAARMFDDVDKYGSKGRPRSAPPSKFQISGNTQASIDKFLQHKKAVEISERLKQQEEELFQSEREARRQERLRESLQAKGFEGMEARTKELEEKQKKAREDYEIEKKAKEDSERAQRMRAKRQQREKPIIKHEISYEDYMEQLEMKRRENVHKRVAEWKSMVVEVPAASMSTTKDGRSSSSPSKTQALAKVRKYQSDLKRVITTLNTQQVDLQRKIEEARSEIKSNSGGDGEGPKHSINFVASMEKRNKMHEAHQAERKAEKEKKEHLARMKQQNEEAIKFQKLLNAKIPEESRKTTRSVSIRASLVKEKMDAMERSQLQSEASLNDHAAVSSSFVPKRDRKSLQQRQAEAVEVTKAHIEAVKKLREIEEEVGKKYASKHK